MTHPFIRTMVGSIETHFTSRPLRPTPSKEQWSVVLKRTLLHGHDDPISPKVQWSLLPSCTLLQNQMYAMMIETFNLLERDLHVIKVLKKVHNN